MTDLLPFFKSIIDQDGMPVVVCNTLHEIIYMNPAAVEAYAHRGGEKLIGLNIMDCHGKESRVMIDRVFSWFQKSRENNIVHTFYKESSNEDVYMVALRDGEGNLIGYYEKHECRTKEKAPRYVMN